MPTRKNFFGVLVFIALAAGIYGYQQFTRENTNLLQAKADYRIGIKEFVKEFEENEKKANEKFLDKVIAVKGIIKDVITDDNHSYTIILGENDILSSVRCSMSRDDRTQADALEINSVITIKGACTGFNADELLGSDVILNRCVIEKSIK